MTEITAGAYITWQTWCGNTTHYVVYVGNHYGRTYTLRAFDGYDETHEQLPARGARLATAEEAAEFERIRAGRLAPVAYE